MSLKFSLAMPTNSGTSSRKEIMFTLRDPPYTYIRLTVKPFSTSRQGYQPTQSLDAITVLTYLDSALRKFLGITGSAIPIDILKVEGLEAWIRVPHKDEGAIVAALSQWTSHENAVNLRVVAKGSWLGGLGAGTMMENEKGTLWSLEP